MSSVSERRFMQNTVAIDRGPALLLRSEKASPTEAKVNFDHLRKAETTDWKVLLGAAIKRARSRREWSLNELAGKIPLPDGRPRDDRQVARWETGDERPHWDALFGIEPYFRQLLIVSLAELSGESVYIETVVRIRRSL